MITPYRHVGLAVCGKPSLSVVLPDGGDRCSHCGEDKSHHEGSKHDTRDHTALPFLMWPLRIYLVTLMKASMTSTSPLTDVRATATGCTPRAPSMQRVFKANRQNQLNSVQDDEWVGIGDRDDDASGAAISSGGRMRCAG